MYLEEGGTYLEEFITALEFVPNDIRGNFELIRELDKESIELNKELADLQSNYLDYLNKVDNNNHNHNDHNDNELNSSSKYINEINSLRERIRQRLTHKISIVNNTSSIVSNITKKLDSDLAFFETELRGCGEFDSVKGIPPGTEVAIKLLNQDNEIILGRIILYHSDIGQYDIADIDDSKRYYLPESQVLSLDSLDYTRKFSKGEIVYAVYPDTTSFYQAVITHVNKKSINHLHEPSVTVQFDGDADPVTGVSPLYVVSMKYVLKLPAIK